MEARISAGLALTLWPWSEPQFLICRAKQLIPTVSTVQRIKRMHTKHLAQLIFLITYTPHSQKYMTFLAKTCLGAEPMTQFYLIPVRPQVVRIYFRCIKSESGIKGHVGKGSGSEQTHLSSKPHLEERCYYFLFLHVKKDQISDTLLLDQYILLKKKKKFL